MQTTSFQHIFTAVAFLAAPLLCADELQDPCALFLAGLDTTVTASSTIQERIDDSYQKICVVSDGSCENAVINNTNCWLAAAREHGRLVGVDSSTWHELAEIDDITRVICPDGVVIIDSPYPMGDESQEYMAQRVRIKKALQLKQLYKRNKETIKSYICKVVLSPSFNSLQLPDRNSIISNIVEAAHFTAEEAASLGLTNVVDQVSE